MDMQNILAASAYPLIGASTALLAFGESAVPFATVVACLVFVWNQSAKFQKAIDQIEHLADKFDHLPCAKCEDHCKIERGVGPHS